ncbi:MAG TPA: GNAT family N-acetyltransferase [Gaiellaceae bacterium]|nr:GNAT family N-acetyltransferase [Gaiellaceae bacterium]
MFTVRPAADVEEFGRALYGIGQYFGGPPTEEQLERFTQVLPLERMYAGFEGDEIVGGAGSFPFELSVPGGSLACAGVTVVGVYPTHRRRGVLRQLMHAQLRDVHERGEPIAALWASEETIYGRFGYGLASWAGEISVQREWASFAQPLERRGRMRFVEPEEAARLFPPVWEALRRERPGVFARSERWWALRRLRLPEEEKANPKRLVVLELDGEPAGYAIFKSQMSFESGIAASTLEVLEAVGATPQATAEVWRFLFDIDWQARITAQLLPPDHALFTLLANPRRAAYRMGDGLWVRLVDAGEALAGRAYAGDGSVVFEVRDAVCPWNEGRWRVSADGEVASTADPAELALDVSALGSAYLGAVSFAQLRDGLRVEELVGGAIARADALFGWRPLPWCPEIF